MKQFLLLAFFLSAGVAAGRDREPIQCEVKAYDTENSTLTVECPPSFIFSPIRVDMSLNHIDQYGWGNLDLTQGELVEMYTSQPRKISLRLPHRNSDHRWRAWRQFGGVVRILVREDHFKMPKTGDRSKSFSGAAEMTRVAQPEGNP